MSTFTSSRLRSALPRSLRNTDNVHGSGGITREDPPDSPPVAVIEKDAKSGKPKKSRKPKRLRKP